eukprot:6410827-Ditylum_brightwellii.AAC.1
MSKHQTEQPMAYIHRFTVAVNKLCNYLKPREAIQVPPTHMFPYYLIDGLCSPKEDFLQILSDLKKNAGSAESYINSNSDILFTLKKAMEHTKSSKEIKGFLCATTQVKLPPKLPIPSPNKVYITNQHMEKFITNMTAANSKEDKVTILKQYNKKTKSGGCCLQPGAQTHQ